MTDADVRGYRLEMYRDPEDGSWVAEVPDLPGCVAGGQTVEEAVEMVGDAIEAWIGAAAASGRAIPLPRAVDEEHSGRFLLRVPRKLHAQLARLARLEGVSLNAYCATALAESVGAAEVMRALVSTRFTHIGQENEAPRLRLLTSSDVDTANEHVGETVATARFGASEFAAIMRTTGKVVTQ